MDSAFCTSFKRMPLCSPSRPRRQDAHEERNVRGIPQLACVPQERQLLSKLLDREQCMVERIWDLHTLKITGVESLAFGERFDG